MKFSKKNCCKNCTLKCDLYKAMLNGGYEIGETDFLHVFSKRHEIICKQGAPVTHAIYMVNGSAKLYIEGLNHRNVILYLMRPRSYIGLLSFFETPKYSYTVESLEESQVCMVDLNFVKKLYIENHEFLITLNKAFGKSVASIMQKIITLNQKNIRGRVADSLLYLSDLHGSQKFNMLLTRKELGELSAISEENTVRLLTEFKNEGIISVASRNIGILDKPLLKRISEFG